ncbi:MAG: EamA family transporter [Lachnospiraceae bacterium]|nr:EamA family transporter [Lachnospiraceae bacterium]
MKEKSSRIGIFIILQIMNVLYSINSVLIKVVSTRWESQGLFKPVTLLLLFAAVAVLGVYAILWQKILTKVDLTVAYMCKGMIIFWGMLWAFLIFGEQITAWNLAGTVIIFAGTYLVTS